MNKHKHRLPMLQANDHHHHHHRDDDPWEILVGQAKSTSTNLSKVQHTNMEAATTEKKERTRIITQKNTTITTARVNPFKGGGPPPPARTYPRIGKSYS